MRSISVKDAYNTDLINTESLWISFHRGFDFGDASHPTEYADIFEIVDILAEGDGFYIDYRSGNGGYIVLVASDFQLGIAENGDIESLFPTF